MTFDFGNDSEAFDILAQSNWSKLELEAYDRYLDEIRSSANQIDTAFDNGQYQKHVY